MNYYKTTLERAIELKAKEKNILKSNFKIRLSDYQENDEELNELKIFLSSIFNYSADKTSEMIAVYFKYQSDIVENDVSLSNLLEKDNIAYFNGLFNVYNNQKLSPVRENTVSMAEGILASASHFTDMYFYRTTFYPQANMNFHSLYDKNTKGVYSISVDIDNLPEIYDIYKQNQNDVYTTLITLYPFLAYCPPHFIVPTGHKGCQIHWTFSENAKDTRGFYERACKLLAQIFDGDLSKTSMVSAFRLPFTRHSVTNNKAGLIRNKAYRANPVTMFYCSLERYLHDAVMITDKYGMTKQLLTEQFLSQHGEFDETGKQIFPDHDFDAGNMHWESLFDYGIQNNWTVKIHNNTSVWQKYAYKNCNTQRKINCLPDSNWRENLRKPCWASYMYNDLRLHLDNNKGSIEGTRNYYLFTMCGVLYASGCRNKDDLFEALLYENSKLRPGLTYSEVLSIVKYRIAQGMNKLPNNARTAELLGFSYKIKEHSKLIYAAGNKRIELETIRRQHYNRQVAKQRKDARNTANKKLLRNQQIEALEKQGKSIATISSLVGCSKRTVASVKQMLKINRICERVTKEDFPRIFNTHYAILEGSKNNEKTEQFINSSLSHSMKCLFEKMYNVLNYKTTTRLYNIYQNEFCKKAVSYFWNAKKSESAILQLLTTTLKHNITGFVPT